MPAAGICRMSVPLEFRANLRKRDGITLESDTYQCSTVVKPRNLKTVN